MDHAVQGCLQSFAPESLTHPGTIVRNVLNHEDNRVGTHEAAKMPESEALLGLTP
jgi:hypothetical protein